MKGHIHCRQKGKLNRKTKKHKRKTVKAHAHVVDLLNSV